VSSYTGTANRPDRAKAIVAVAAVHAGLAAIILSGLNVSVVSQEFERMTTINLREPPPPPPPKPQRHEAMKKPPGAPAPKAQPTPVVAPPTPLPVKSPIAAAKIAGTGSAPSSGAGASGNGTGAGGAGNGPGGGGSGPGTPARPLTRIPNSEYHALSRWGLVNGRVGVAFRVDPQGNPTNCRVAQTSGDPNVDSLICGLVLRYLHFDPARDASGRPIASDITYFPNWHHA
jgi:protein TonB